MPIVARYLAQRMLIGSAGTVAMAGGSSAPAARATILPPGRRKQQQPTLAIYRVIIVASNVPQPAPPVPCSHGIVRACATNGQAAGNSAPVFLGLSQTEALAGPNSALAPMAEVPWPVDHLGKTWICGTQGDGVEFSIKEN